MARELPDNQYPDRIISGDVIAIAFRALRERLQSTFSPLRYTHVTIPAKASVGQWKDLTRKAPMVAIGWAAWRPDPDNGESFRGTLSFPVFLLVEHSTPDALYLGRGDMPGAFGMSALATAMLHGFRIRDVGTCRVTQNTATANAEWIPDGMATVMLEVTIPDVALNTATLIEQLDDFLQLGEKWQADGFTAPESVLEVRGEQ